MSNDNDNGVISFENKKQMQKRRLKVDEILQQRAEMLTLHAATDQFLSEVMRQQRSHLNKQVYDLAERQGVSIYDICLLYMPELSEPRYSHTADGMVNFEQDIRLVPIPFEDRGPGYWKSKYFRLKERMQELINDKED